MTKNATTGDIEWIHPLFMSFCDNFNKALPKGRILKEQENSSMWLPKKIISIQHASFSLREYVLFYKLLYFPNSRRNNFITLIQMRSLREDGLWLRSYVRKRLIPFTTPQNQLPRTSFLRRKLIPRITMLWKWRRS